MAVRAGVATMAFAFAALTTTEARANGRFPSASQLVVRPGHPDEMALRATFGSASAEPPFRQVDPEGLTGPAHKRLGQRLDC